jgi:DNA processing protein
MDQLRTRSEQRLALLLAGCRGRQRRLIKEISPEGSLFEGLGGRARDRALVARARQGMGGACQELRRSLGESGWQWLVPEDTEYPELLDEVSDPPLGLWVRGSLPPGPRVAVVGSRTPTPYGRQVARMLGHELANAGVVVVSGMARGIDTLAHQGCLDGGGLTVAVWGCGPDRVYPAENRALAERIAGHGALITEYPPGTPPRRRNFPERNRVVAGLSAAVVIVEAAVRSGALITARLALEEGREVLAVPGSIFSELSLGPNALLRLGARPLLTVHDVLEEIGEIAKVEEEAAGAADGVAELLPRGDALSVDELARRAGRPVQDLLPELLELELAGVVERLTDGRYCRR